MIYEYACPSCSEVFDVVKSASQMTREEACQCGEIATRKFVPSRVHFTKTKVEHAEFNPGLGCITKNSAHRAEIAKQKGVEEVGSEPVESIHKHFEKVREEKINRSYDDLDRGWIGDGSS